MTLNPAFLCEDNAFTNEFSIRHQVKSCDIGFWTHFYDSFIIIVFDFNYLAFTSII